MSLLKALVFGTEMPPMKNLFVLFALVVGGMTAQAALPQPDLIAQIHFAGGQKISSDRSFLAFTNEFASPEARAVANQTFDRLAFAPYIWFKTKISPKAGNGAKWLRPLFDDLLSSEWFFEARDMPGGSPEYALAIHLDAVRTQVWQNNLRQLLEGWTGIPARNISGGWELKKDRQPDLIRVTEKGGWLLVDIGQNRLVLGELVLGSLAGEINATSNGGKEWLSADINWPRLAQWSAELKTLALPETQFEVTAKDKDLHIEGKFFFPENLPMNLPAWQIPANTIHSPFVSFTAARGFASWLNSQAWARPYEISAVPDQIFVWALTASPFQTFAAIPVPNAVNAVTQAYARLNPALNLANDQNEFIAPFKLAMANNEIQLQGVPFAGPFIRGDREAAGQFLMAGGFSDSGRPHPVPPEILQRLTLKNLVYYHWEITAERFPQVLNMSQLAMVLTQHQQMGGNSPTLKWLQKIAPHLGNTVTEILQTAPDQMTFSRTAPGGLTALEFLMLGNWLEAKNFPGCDLKLPPNQLRGHQAARPLRAINVPAPAH
jgi:hypothetical protein